MSICPSCSSHDQMALALGLLQSLQSADPSSAIAEGKHAGSGSLSARIRSTASQCNANTCAFHLLADLQLCCMRLHRTCQKTVWLEIRDAPVDMISLDNDGECLASIRCGDQHTACRVLFHMHDCFMHSAIWDTVVICARFLPCVQLPFHAFACSVEP